MGNNVADIEFVETGIPVLDVNVKIPRGRWTIFYGRSRSCKSTLSYYIAGQVQKNGGVVCIVDIESSFDKAWAIQQGMDLDATIIVSAGEDFEQNANTIIQLFKELNAEDISVDLLLIDSIQASASRSDKEKTAEDIAKSTKMASLAVKITQFFGYMSPIMASMNCIGIVIGQARDLINNQGTGGTVLSGGNMMKHMSWNIIKMSAITDQKKALKDGKDADGKDIIVGWPIEFNPEKARGGNERNKFQIYFRKGFGMDLLATNISLAIAYGIICQSGAWLSFDMTDPIIVEACGRSDNPRCQGKKAMAQLLEDNPLVYAAVKKAIYNRLNASEICNNDDNNEDSEENND